MPIRHPLALLLAAFAPAWLVACTDSDNVSWVIVSNPSGGTVPVQGGLVISWRYSSKSFGVVTGVGDANHSVALKLEETGGPRGDDPTLRRTIYLGIDNDLLLILAPTGGEVHSPAMPSGTTVIPGGATVVLGPDSATALLVTSAEARLHCAAAGNVILGENAGSVFVMRPDQPRQEFPSGSAIEPAGKDYIIVEPGGRRTLIRVPPSTSIGGQAEFDAARQSYRFFSYTQQLSAELPANRFQVYSGSGGIRMDGNFPNAAGGALDSPFRAVLAARNHHLLLIRNPD